ncbi:glutamine amidotransferase, partial [Klebsiella pneumoniae]|uniref:glutamine amidotransferase n=1 Tax=Klebsiella pneumoniae TaxID=573 RepID=UPI00272F51D1
YFIPSIMLSGFISPFIIMPDWAKAIGSCIPLTYFIRLVKGWDDRIETPEGCYAEVTESHPLFNDIPGEWPWLLGYNEVEMHPEGKLLATVAGTGHPLLAVREYQQGRSLVWTSDMSAHWLPEEFAKWPGYRQLWINCLDWLTERR